MTAEVFWCLNSTERCVRPIWAAMMMSEGTMPRFHIRLPGEIGREHGEIVGDDSVELVILPIRSDLCFIRHLCCRSSEKPFNCFLAR